MNRENVDSPHIGRRSSQLGSIAGLYEREHELHAHCPHCDRWSVLDLERMVRTGQGARRLPLKVRCRECGDIGVLQLRPPVPPPSRTGWIMPPTLR